MAKSFKVVIVTPDHTAYEGDAVSATIPGLAGYIGIWANHAPLVAATAREGASGVLISGLISSIVPQVRRVRPALRTHGLTATPQLEADSMVSLLARFYEPTAGRILIDGNDIAELTLHALREQISIVLQDVFLFHGTVEENIA